MFYNFTINFILGNIEGNKLFLRQCHSDDNLGDDYKDTIHVFQTLLYSLEYVCNMFL